MADCTRQFVLYLIQRSKKPLGKTALLKLAYLADVEHYRRVGTQLGYWWWKRDQRGPVFYAIADEAERLKQAGFLEIKRTSTHSGSQMLTYIARPNISMRMDEEWKEMADYVIEEYSALPLDKIKDAAYQTEPMLPNPTVGQELDMTLIKQYKDLPPKQADTSPALRPSEQTDVRGAIASFIVWNQAMEDVPSSQERAEAAYDEALHNRRRIFER